MNATSEQIKPVPQHHAEQRGDEIYLGEVPANFVCGWSSLRCGVADESGLRPAFVAVAEVAQELHRKQSLMFNGNALARMLEHGRRVAAGDEDAGEEVAETEGAQMGLFQMEVTN